MLRRDPWPIVDSQFEGIPGPIVILDTGAVWLHLGAQAIPDVADTLGVGFVSRYSVLGSEFESVRFERDFVDRGVVFRGERRQIGLIGTSIVGDRSLALDWDEGVVSVLEPNDSARFDGWVDIPSVFVGTERRRIVVEAIVGNDRRSLLIDTGAVSVILGSEAFSRAVSSPVLLGTSTVGRVGRMSVGDETFLDVGVSLANDDLIDTIRREAGTNVEGVIGMNVLGCLSLLADYGLTSLSLKRAGCAERSDPLASVGLGVRFDGQSGVVVVNVHPEDRRNGAVLEGWRLASVDGRSAQDLLLGGEYQVATSGRVGTTHVFSVACSTCATYHDVNLVVRDLVARE